MSDIANPISLTSLNSNSIVSDLEDALMQSISQGMQTGQSTNDATVQQEMRLLTELLNQSDNTNSSPSQTTNSDPSSSSDPSATSGSKHNHGMQKTESKLESALEQDITRLLENGQAANNSNALQQEMNLLIQLLGQGA